MPDPELLREWHPLDNTAAPEYVPPQWDGPHVGKRFAEACAYRLIATTDSD